MRCICSHLDNEHHPNSKRCLIHNCDCPCFEGQDLVKTIEEKPSLLLIAFLILLAVLFTWALLYVDGVLR